MTKRTKSSVAMAIDFFKKHAGYARSPGETIAQAKKKCATDLALAEAYASQAGWTVSWEEDPEPYQTGFEDDVPDEVFIAVLKDEGGKVIGSLGGIGGPISRSYTRIVEAELAMEAYIRLYNK